MIIVRSTKILTKIVFISSSQKYKSEPRIMLKAKKKEIKKQNFTSSIYIFFSDWKRFLRPYVLSKTKIWWKKGLNTYWEWKLSIYFYNKRFKDLSYWVSRNNCIFKDVKEHHLELDFINIYLFIYTLNCQCPM